MMKISGIYRLVPFPDKLASVYLHHDFIFVGIVDDDEGTPVRKRIRGTSLLLNTQAETLMDDPEYPARILRKAFHHAYFDKARSVFRFKEAGSDSPVQVDSVYLSRVTIEVTTLDEAKKKSKSRRKSKVRRTLGILRKNPRLVFASKGKEESWRPRKGQKLGLSYHDRAHERPSHFARWEVRSIAGKRELVLVERFQDSDGRISGGKWLYRKPKTQRR